MESGTIVNTNSNGSGIEQTGNMLTITGGTIKGGRYGIRLNPAVLGSLMELDMQGGTVEGTQYGIDSSSGGAYISGGEIRAVSTIGGTGLNALRAVITGATAAVTNSASDGVAGGLLMPGYVFIDGNSEIVDAFASASITDAVTATSHTGHSFGDWQDNGDGYHIQICAVCRLPKQAPHSYVDGVCGVCGAYQDTEAARLELSDGTMRTYPNLSLAWDAAVKSAGSATVTLLQSVTQEKGLNASQSCDVTLKMDSGVSLTVTSGTALTASRSARITLKDCTITGPAGVEVALTGQVTVEGGSITATTGAGLLTGSSASRKIVLKNAKISGAAYGLYNDQGVNITAEGCTFSGNTAALYTKGVLTAENCTFNSTGGMGLDLRQSASTLTGCTVNAAGCGVQVTDAGTVTIPDGSFTGTPALSVASNAGAKLSGGTFAGGISGALQGLLLDNSCAYYIGGERQVLTSGQMSLSGTVTVQPDTSTKPVVVTVDGNETEYDWFSDAWNAANGQTAHIQLRRSQALSVTLTLSGGEVTVDMNPGVELTAEKTMIQLTSGTLNINSGTMKTTSGNVICTSTSAGTAALSINGGVFEAPNYALYPTSGTVDITITGGTVTSGDKGLWSTAAGTITIHGGTFSGGVSGYGIQNNTANTLRIYGGTINRLWAYGGAKLYGGMFTGGITAASGTLADLLPDGKAFVQENGRYFTGAEGKTTTVSPLIIGDCVHDYAYTADADTHTGVCKICRKALTGAHDWADGACTVCGAERVAQVGSEYFLTVEDAWAALTGKTGTLRLLKNVETATTLTVNEGMNVTIEMDDGVVLSNSSNDCFQVKGGTLTLASGGVSGMASGKSIVYAASGTLCITGGAYQSQGNGLWIDAGAVVRLSGGSFSASGTILRYQSHTILDMLDKTRQSAGIYFALSIDGNLVTSGLDKETLTGSCEVCQCTSHVLLWREDSEGLHYQYCPACGYETTHEAHSGDTCTVCGMSCSVSVEIDGATTRYMLLDTAWAAVQGKTATLTILQDLSLTSNMSMSDANTDLTIQALPGVTVESTSDFFIVSAGKLTLASGDFVSSGDGKSGIYMTGGEVEMTGGSITMTGSNQAKGIRINGNTGKLTLSGGTLEVTDAGADQMCYALLVTRGSVTLTHCTLIAPDVSGGYSRAVSVDVASGQNVGSLLGDGCAYFIGDNVYEAGDSALSGYVFRGTVIVDSIERTPLEESMVKLDAAEYFYNGTDRRPAVTIEGLTAGTDFTVTYPEECANAGTYQVTVTGTGGYMGTVTLEYKIKPVPVSAGTTPAASGTYGDKLSDLAFTAGTVSGEDGVTVAGTWKFQGSEVLDAGEHTRTAYFVLDSMLLPGNYDLSRLVDGVTATVTINRKTIEPEVVIAPDSYGYTGSQIRPGEDVGTSVRVMYGTVELPASEYTLAYGDNTAIGTGTVTVTDSGGGNYNITTAVTQDFTITKPSLNGAEVSMSAGSFVYTGAEQTPEVTVTLNGKQLTKDADYTVSYSGNKTVGTATVTVAGTGSYCGSVEAKFDIKAAPITATGVTGSASKDYDGTTACDGADLTITFTGGVGGDDVSVTASKFVYASANAGTGIDVTASGLSLSGSAAGNYTLTDSSSVTGAVGEIAKAAITSQAVPQTLNISNSLESTYIFLLSNLRPSISGEWGTVTYEIAVSFTVDGYYTGGAAVIANPNSGSGVLNTLSLPIQFNPVETLGEVGTVAVTIKSTNYKDFTNTLSIAASSKEKVEFSGIEGVTVPYNGQRVTGYTGTLTARTADGTEVTLTPEVRYTGRLSTSYDDAGTPPVNAGTYSVIFRVPDDDPNYIGRTNVSFEITPAPVTIKADDHSR